MYPPPGYPQPTPTTRDADREALTYLLWAAIIWLCSGAVTLVLLDGTAALYTVDTTSSGSTFVFHPLFYVVAVASGALSIVQVLLLRGSFHRLAPVDPRFSTPSTLALLLIAGFVIVLLGLVPLLQGAQSITGCIASSNNTTLPASCGGIGQALIGIVLVLVGGIIALIGYIGCLLGIWRFGSRYGNDLFKVGAILLIFPLLNVVGAILILVGASSVRARVEAMGTPGPPRF